MLNLDYICIKYGQQLPRDKNTQNLIRKSLRVLKEDGVYAMFLFIENNDKNLREKLIPLLNEKQIASYLLNTSELFPIIFKEFSVKLQSVSQFLDKLFFLKKILERTLVYALYHSEGDVL